MTTTAPTPLGCPECGSTAHLTIQYVAPGDTSVFASEGPDGRSMAPTSSPRVNVEQAEPWGIECSTDGDGGCGWLGEAPDDLPADEARAALLGLLAPAGGSES